MADGDLWTSWAKLVHMKGPTAVHVSWVKGHATAAMVEAGLLTAAERTEQRHADDLANEAKGSHVEGLVPYASICQARMEQYALVIAHVLKHKIAVYKRVLHLHDLAQGTAPGTRRKTPSIPLGRPLGYARDADLVARHLAPMSHARDDPIIVQVFAFILAFKWQLAPPRCQGITWLELMCLFELQGGVLDGAHVAEPGRPPILFRPLLAKFKAAVRKAVASGLTPGDQVFFKPSKVAASRLHALAYSTSAAAICGLPVLDDALADSVA
jgi:hypothetical protein